MIEGHKIIEEVDPALEHSFTIHNPIAPSHPTSTFKEMTRDVDKLISRLSHQKQMASSYLLDFDNNQPKIEQNPYQNESIMLNKYNYTGRAYRFQQAERQLNISKAEIQQQCRTEQHIEKDNSDKLSLRSNNDSKFAQQSLNRSQLKYPSHDYYIMFDKKKSPGDFPQTFKTMYLQKKVDQLENQVKKIKAVSRTVSTNFRAKEGKMKLDRLLDSILG